MHFSDCVMFSQSLISIVSTISVIHHFLPFLLIDETFPTVYTASSDLGSTNF